VNAYVLDASVAAKWILPARDENRIQESRTVLESYMGGRLNLSVPDLFWPEIGNILWKANRLKRMTARGVEDGIVRLLDLNIRTLPSQPMLANAVSIAMSFDRTVYDSIYIAMAVMTGRPLLTADEKLANALAAYFPVRWLGAFC
jgi:predicted nucleic acid-binding protein